MKSFEERLEHESAAWVADGLISGEQREQLLARHSFAEGGGGNRFMAILAGIGGALFFVGVSLLIKANWELIGDWTKIAGLVVLMTGMYGLGWRLKMGGGQFPKTGDACLMVGSVCFMLGIALVSRIFHLNSRPANGVLLWWAGIAIIPWLTRAKGAQFVSLVAGLTWLFMESQEPGSWLRLTAEVRRWYEDEYLVAAAGFFLGGALAFFGASLRGGRHDHFAGLHEKLGLSIACSTLYVLGFAWSTHNWSDRALPGARWQPALVSALLFLAALGWAWRRTSSEAKRLAWPLAAGVIPAAGRLWGLELHDSGWLWGGLACLALFLLNLGMIRAGLASGRESWINLGIAGIALNVVTRYFLLFGTMLEGGLFFIVTGLVVAGLGYYLERKRRAFVGAVRKESAA